MPVPQLDDPRWFLADYAFEHDRFHFIRLELEQITRATFLDRRMQADWGSVEQLDAATVAPPARTAALLFHTAFCGSTLLAKALHAAPVSVSLKEPLVLQRLAMAWLRMPDRRTMIETRLRSAISLLARPWAPQGRVLVKPANQSNVLLRAMCEHRPSAHAVLLYSGLDDFMLSCFKKLPEAETRIRWMAQSLLPGTRLARALRVDTATPFNLVESCVLAWYAQMERYADLLASDVDDLLRSLDFVRMLRDPLPCVEACGRWLGLETTGLHARVASAFSRDSKAEGRSFDARRRDSENQRAMASYGAIIDQGLRWAESHVAPQAMLPVRWKPLTF